VFEENVNGSWQQVQFDGQTVEEVAQTSFTTGEAPDYIPPSNVEYSYPLVDQYNFYPGEYDKGFIQLKRGQSYLFAANTAWTQKGRIVDEAGINALYFNFSYDGAKKKVNFNLPGGLSLAKYYSLDLVNTPRNQAATIDENVSKLTTGLIQGEDSLAQLTTKSLEGQISLAEEKSIYNSLLRTSRYSTLGEKLRGLDKSQTFRHVIDPFLVQLRLYFFGQELFESSEGETILVDKPLLQFEARLEGVSWYENEVFPVVYEGYPFGPISIQHRDPSVLGVPPIRDLYLQQGPSFYQFEPTPQAGDQSKTVYNLMTTMREDLRDLQHQTANRYVNSPSLVTDRLLLLLTNSMPLIGYGRYPFVMKYVLPDGTVTSSHSLEFNYVSTN
jgi:hypothetical protein